MNAFEQAKMMTKFLHHTQSPFSPDPHNAYQDFSFSIVSLAPSVVIFITSSITALCNCSHGDLILNAPASVLTMGSTVESLQHLEDPYRG